MEVIILAIVAIVLAVAGGSLIYEIHSLGKTIQQYQQMTDRYVEIRRKELGLK